MLAVLNFGESICDDESRLAAADNDIVVFIGYIFRLGLPTEPLVPQLGIACCRLKEMEENSIN